VNLARVSLVGILAGSVVLGACSPEEAKHKAAGNVLFKQGDLDGAAREYREAIKANAKDANGHTLLGNALFEQARYDESRREYEAALALDAKARAALQGLVMIDLREQKDDAARATLERMLANQPRDSEAHAALGKILYAKGDLAGAERNLREALVYAQNDPSALYTLGLVLAKKKDQDQAGVIFDRLERVTPGKAYAPYGRAVAAAAAGRSDEALEQLAVALDRGIEDLGQVERDDSFAAIRSLPKFAELVAAARTRAPPKKGSPGP
jgi:tetratricopeptide (TPR) repeat protein